jgi:hypothetical protein
MRPILLLALACAAAPARLSGAPARVVTTDSTMVTRANEVYDGRSGQTRVKPPRLEETGSDVDGSLGEAQWTSASLLTGFSQFSPVDGVPSEDSTEVLVWYSPTAIHFGIRAYEPHGAVRATLANRDNISSDDNIQLLLGTFNDGRQAMVFGLNPLGVQMDGMLIETNAARANDFMSKATSRDQADLSPHYLIESKGRLTAYGYEIEVRVPFKSLKYPNGDAQTWGLNVVRIVQHSGHEDSWAPAKRASLSFLGQSGVVEGMTDLRRGLVVDITPEITQRTTGAPTAVGGDGWNYAAGKPQVGGTVRWGVTNNMTLNATANPDFSQVESDAGQFAFDPRQALYFTEKRPFFLDGSEQFAAPHNLIYTRRIVQPVAAAKLAGKMAGTNIAVLSAVDRKTGALYGEDNPVYNILRVRRDFGGRSQLGATYTDRIEGASYNRVGALDGRYVFGGIYSVQGLYAQSSSRFDAATTLNGPLWNSVLSRNGKAFGIRYSIDGISDRFRTQTGFIGRGGLVTANFDHRFTWTAPAGRWLESVSFSPVFVSRWGYQRFIDHGDAIEKLVHLNLAAAARGGWNGGFGLLTETFGFDPKLYANYRILRGPGDTIAFRGVGRIPNQDWVASLSTPEWQKLSANALYLWGHDENFFEWQSANIIYASYGLTLRPSQKLRADASYQVQSYRRRPEGTMVGEFRIPRLKVEYQLDRAIFFRLVGEYQSGVQDALIDAGRTGLPLIVDGALSPGFVDSRFRGDFLFSYAPMPGTVFFLGYGAGYADTRADPRPYSFPRSLGLRGYDRQDDALFIKASYLLRL